MRCLALFIMHSWLIMLLLVTTTVLASDDRSPEARWVSAISNDKTTELKALLSEASSVSKLVGLRADTGKSALMIACKLGDRELIDTLLDQGADVNAVTKTGGTPLMFASLGGHAELVRYLSTFNVDINAQGANGWSATMIAAAKGYVDLLSLLIELGGDVDAQDVYRWTPLMRAVDNRHDDAVRVLLNQKSIALNVQDESGNTALHHAAVHGEVMSVSRLIQQGADASIENDSGHTAVQLAAASPNADLLANVFSAR